MIEAIQNQLKPHALSAALTPVKVWQPALSIQIQNAPDVELFGNKPADDAAREMRQACRAGLLLLNDDLEASHHLAQQIETMTGSFWHAIMHRREGDFSNSQYWLQQAGSHPALRKVRAAAVEV